MTDDDVIRFAEMTDDDVIRFAKMTNDDIVREEISNVEKLIGGPLTEEERAEYAKALRKALDAGDDPDAAKEAGEVFLAIVLGHVFDKDWVRGVGDVEDVDDEDADETEKGGEVKRPGVRGGKK